MFWKKLLSRRQQSLDTSSLQQNTAIAYIADLQDLQDLQHDFPTARVRQQSIPHPPTITMKANASRSLTAGIACYGEPVRAEDQRQWLCACPTVANGGVAHNMPQLLSGWTSVARLYSA